MSDQTSSSSGAISRRRIVQGSAWAVPAIALAGAAPAMAASPLTMTCELQASLLQQQAGSTSPAISAMSPSSDYPGGTQYAISMGIMNIGTGYYLYGQPITGFYANPGYCGTPCELNTTVNPPEWQTAVAGDGTLHTWQTDLYTPYQCSPQTAGAGLSMDVTVGTTIPYNSQAGEVNRYDYPQSYLNAISIPVTITYLNGLAPINNDLGQPAESCCVYMNLRFEAGGVSVLDPRPATSVSWTTTPLYTAPITPPTPTSSPAAPVPVTVNIARNGDPTIDVLALSGATPSAGATWEWVRILDNTGFAVTTFPTGRGNYSVSGMNIYYNDYAVLSTAYTDTRKWVAMDSNGMMFYGVINLNVAAG